MLRIVFTTDVVRHAFGCVFLKNLPKKANEQKRKIFDNCAHSYFDNLPLPGKKHKLTQINAISHLLQYLHPNWMWKENPAPLPRPPQKIQWTTTWNQPNGCCHTSTHSSSFQFFCVQYSGKYRLEKVSFFMYIFFLFFVVVYRCCYFSIHTYFKTTFVEQQCPKVCHSAKLQMMKIESPTKIVQRGAAATAASAPTPLAYIHTLCCRCCHDILTPLCLIHSVLFLL